MVRFAELVEWAETAGCAELVVLGIVQQVLIQRRRHCINQYWLNRAANSAVQGQQQTLPDQQVSPLSLPTQQVLPILQTLPTQHNLQPQSFSQQYATLQLPVPVPAQLQLQILWGEFIDFAVLLDKILFDDATQQYTHKHASFSTLMQAWNIYLTVIFTYNLTRALALVGYQCIITSAGHSLPLKAWLQYDRQFHTIATSNPSLHWDQRHLELWYEVMAAANNTNQDKKWWSCAYRWAKNHYYENCPCSPFCDSSQYPKSSNLRVPGAPICSNFTNGHCTRNAFTFQHICLSCKSPYPRMLCLDNRAVT